MEIAKEKFIETFINECKKAEDSMSPNSFRSSNAEGYPMIEIIANKNVSFFTMKSLNDDEKKTHSFVGKILFDGFVDYKSIELTEDEFNSIYECYEKSEQAVRTALKNKIIIEGETALLQVLQH